MPATISWVPAEVPSVCQRLFRPLASMAVNHSLPLNCVKFLGLKPPWAVEGALAIPVSSYVPAVVPLETQRPLLPWRSCPLKIACLPKAVMSLAVTRSPAMKFTPTSSWVPPAEPSLAHRALLPFAS